MKENIGKKGENPEDILEEGSEVATENDIDADSQSDATSWKRGMKNELRVKLYFTVAIQLIFVLGLNKSPIPYGNT